ncbi:hypothetical protein AACH06_25375 [Ideonella sp. DXS29W]|uniref:Uncharacterized protein n=1 Tax=Ideonella lacteola TaxID=2984193 RepID=A0ABU9BWG9_9BURK
MTNTTHLRAGSLLIGFAVAAMACGAQAQAVQVPKTAAKGLDGLHQPQLAKALQAPSWVQAEVSDANIRQAMDVAASRPLSPVPVLQGFSFSFQNGDHKLNRIGVLPDGRVARLTFADQDGNDPFAARAQFALVNAGVVQQETKVGGGQFEIPLKGRPGDTEVPVLCGFDFIRRVGTDANLRAIGAWIDEARQTIRVTLMDDQGADFRGFEGSVGATLAVGAVVPYGVLMGSAVSTFDAARRLTDGGKYRPYGVTVCYAWVSPKLFEGNDQITGTSPTPSSGKRITGPIALTGFEFFFLNSDHHLKEIGVFDLGLQAARGNADHVIFKDNNLDDPIRWAVAYRSFKPGTKKQ